MILPILVTLFAVIALLYIGTFRRPTKKLISVSSILGIYILQSAHTIFIEAESIIHEHHYVFSASFIMMYIPLIIQYQQPINGSLRNYFPGKFFLILSFIISAGLYLKAILHPDMTLYSYAPWIWGLCYLILCFACLRKIIFQTKKQAFPPYHRKLDATLTYLLLVIFAPVIISLLISIFPSDNYLIPYKPLISEEKSIYLLSMVLLIMFTTRLIELRKSFHSSGQMKSDDKLTDFAW